MLENWQRSKIWLLMIGYLSNGGEMTTLKFRLNKSVLNLIFKMLQPNHFLVGQEAPLATRNILFGQTTIHYAV